MIRKEMGIPIIRLSTILIFFSTPIHKNDKMWIDSKFAERLRQAQKNRGYALVNDIIVTKKKNLYSIYVILNNGNTKGRRRLNSNLNVILYVGNRRYKNRFNPGYSQLQPAPNRKNTITQV